MSAACVVVVCAACVVGAGAVAVEGGVAIEQRGQPALLLRRERRAPRRPERRLGHANDSDPVIVALLLDRKAVLDDVASEVAVPQYPDTVDPESLCTPARRRVVDPVVPVCKSPEYWCCQRQDEKNELRGIGAEWHSGMTFGRHVELERLLREDRERGHHVGEEADHGVPLAQQQVSGSARQQLKCKDGEEDIREQPQQERVLVTANWKNARKEVQHGHHVENEFLPALPVRYRPGEIADALFECEAFHG